MKGSRQKTNSRTNSVSSHRSGPASRTRSTWALRRSQKGTPDRAQNMVNPPPRTPAAARTIATSVRPKARAVLAGLPGHAGAAEKRLRHLQDAGQAALRRSLSRHRQGAGPAVPRLQSRPRQLQGQPRLYPGRDGLSGGGAARRRRSSGVPPATELDSTSRSRVQQAPAPNAAESPKAAIQRLFFVDLELQIYRTGGRRREISRKSAGKFRAGHMSASSLPPELPLDSAPWAEALIGGQAVVEPAGRPQEAPGTDEPAAGHSGLPLTSRTRSNRRSR